MRALPSPICNDPVHLSCHVQSPTLQGHTSPRCCFVQGQGVLNLNLVPPGKVCVRKQGTLKGYDVGLCRVQGFFEANLIQTLEFVESATLQGGTYPTYIIDNISKALGQALTFLSFSIGCISEE